MLTVTKARKGKRHTDPIRAPKNNRPKRLPIDPELAEWIEQWVPLERRLAGGPLFQNPRSHDPARRWAASALRRRWQDACRVAGLTDRIALYEGCKHTFATAAKARGIEDRVLQRFLEHKDRRSVERYARLSDSALIAVLRPPKTPRTAIPAGDLSPACRQG